MGSTFDDNQQQPQPSWSANTTFQNAPRPALSPWATAVHGIGNSQNRALFGGGDRGAMTNQTAASAFSGQSPQNGFAAGNYAKASDSFRYRGGNAAQGINDNGGVNPGEEPAPQFNAQDPGKADWDVYSSKNVWRSRMRNAQLNDYNRQKSDYESKMAQWNAAHPQPVQQPQVQPGQATPYGSGNLGNGYAANTANYASGPVAGQAYAPPVPTYSNGSPLVTASHLASRQRFSY